MTQQAYTIGEFKHELHAINKQILNNLVQCGLDLAVTTDSVQKVKVFRIIRDERNPMRQFMDLVQGAGFNIRIEITMYDPEDPMEEPQLIYNTLMLCKANSESLLDTFFSMAEATMHGNKENWEKARALMPDGIAALEELFSRQTIGEKIQEALNRIRLGDLSSIRPPSKSTN